MPSGMFIKWMQGMSHTGVLIGEIHYGLINPDNEGEDVMVHKSLLEKETMVRYTRVLYEKEWDHDHNMWICTNIEVDKRPPPPPPLGPPPPELMGEPAHKHPRCS
jgi:hypothetical protein